ncbi:MAG: hypothetical protein ACYDEX_24755 [Mobilitalea sp.]
MAKKTDEFYSLLNVTNGNLLSAKLHSMSYYGSSDNGIKKRPRNWKISQFDVESHELLDHFVNGVPIQDDTWSMGVHQIWVKEEDIDMLYSALALAVLTHFCGYHKSKALFGAFLFHKDPQLFLTEDFMSTQNSPKSTMIRLRCGKEFMDFLETFGILSFAKNRWVYANGKQTKIEEERHFFSSAELELVKRQRKDIITTFEKTRVR